MIDIESTVFNAVAAEFDAKYPNGSRYGESTDSPAAFPCFTLVEADNYTYERSLTAAHKEHNAWLLYEINVYSAKISGAKQECKAIMELIDNVMQNLGFVRLFCTQTRNSDKKYYRMTARYRGVVSEEYRIYRR